MRPIFEYDHVRGALLVRLDVSDDYGRADRSLFAINGDPMDTVRVGDGDEPPLFVPPITDLGLLGMVLALAGRDHKPTK